MFSETTPPSPQRTRLIQRNWSIHASKVDGDLYAADTQHDVLSMHS